MNPEELKRLRKAKGLSLRNLAKKVGVSHSLLYLIEKGERRPKEELLDKILAVLEIDFPQFMESSLITDIEPYYRLERRMRKREIERIKGEVLEFLKIYIEIEQIAEKVTTLKNEYPYNFSFTEKYKVSTMEEIEEVVLDVRNRLSIGIDPIRNVTDLLEDIGIRVIYIDGLKDFWAMAFELQDRSPVIALKRGIAGDRGRFSLSHELGHILLEPSESLNFEQVAHRFAGAFLFPKSACILQFGERRSAISLEELKIAKFKYGVSMTSILHRLFDLGIISSPLYKRYRKEFNSKGWDKREPVELEKESPGKIKRLLLILEQEGIIDIHTRMEYEYKLFGIWGL